MHGISSAHACALVERNTRPPADSVPPPPAATKIARRGAGGIARQPGGMPEESSPAAPPIDYIDPVIAGVFPLTLPSGSR